MKGVIACCLRDLVVSLRGEAMWEQCLESAGVDKKTTFLPISDVPDATVMAVIQSVCKNMDLTIEQAADAFGDYWVNVYAQKMYKNYFQLHRTARDFLLAMDRVHKEMTLTMKDAHPPRFSYEWKDARTLIMTYDSQRGLIDLLVGLVKGVGRFYRERLVVTKLSPTQVRIVFP